MFKKVLLGLFIGLCALIAIAESNEPSKSPAQIAADAAEKARYDWAYQVKYAVKRDLLSSLKDPTGAVIESAVVAPPPGFDYNSDVKSKDPVYVCGQVNAKNSFGGYTGWKRFVWISDDGLYAEDFSGARFLRAWRKHCEKAKFL